MLIGDKENLAELMALMPPMKEHTAEWQIISAKLSPQGKENIPEVLQELSTIYHEKDGFIYLVRDYKIVVIVRLGLVPNYASLKAELEANLPKRYVRIVTRKMTPQSIEQIQKDLADENNADTPLLYQQRETRKENVFLVAEDDAFVRQTLVQALQEFGQVHEVADGADVLAAYKKHNPDILLLDIHLPNTNGLALVDQIMQVDPDAFIVIASADSKKDNVILSVSGGAEGFLTKPARKERLVEYLHQCLTFQPVKKDTDDA